MDSSTGEEVWRAVPSLGRLYQGARLGSRRLVATNAECSDEESTNSRLVAFDAATGQRLWTTSGVGIATRTMFWAASPTVAADAQGVVVMGGGRFGPGVKGLDARTGTVRWRSRADQRELGVSANLVFSAQSKDENHLVLNAHSRRTGSLRWTFPTTQGLAWGNIFDVVTADAHTVVVANGNYLTRLGSRPASTTTFFVLDARTGDEKVHFVADDPSFESSDFVMTGGLLIYAEGPTVVGRDLTNGAVRWQHRFEATPYSPGDTGIGVRYTGGRARVLVQVQQRVVALDSRSGTRRWSIDDAWVAAGNSHTTILRVANSSRFRAIDPRTGKTRWQRRVPRRIGNPGDSVSVSLARDRLAFSMVCDTG